MGRADVNNRRFGDQELRAVFRILDGGGTRAEVRAFVQRSQGRGVSNATIAALRETHRQLRRSQGYLVGQRGQRNLIDPNTGRLRRVRDLPRARTLPPSRRPLPPPGVRASVSVEYTKYDSAGRPVGRAFGSFTVGPDEPSLSEQITDASMDEETVTPGAPASGGLRVLGVRF